MKEWKQQIVEALSEQTRSSREFYFKDIVEKLGYKHIKNQDIRDIIVAFQKKNPEYKAIQFDDIKNYGKRLYDTLVLTELDYVDEDFLDMIRSYFGDDRDKIKIVGGTVKLFRINGEIVDAERVEDLEYNKNDEVVQYEYDFNKMRMRGRRIFKNPLLREWHDWTSIDFNNIYKEL